MNWKTKTRLCIGVCENRDKTDKPLMLNLMEMEKPDRYIVAEAGKHIKSASLNKIVENAYEHDCTHIFFMDADMEFPLDTIPRLLSHNQPIVGGLYHIKEFPFSPVAGWNRGLDKSHSDTFFPDRINGRGRMWKSDYYPLPEGQLVEVHWTGIGCLMVDMDVFDKIYTPCFWDDWDRGAGTRLRGHDLVFSDAVREVGFRIFIDTLVDCGHRQVWTIDKTFIDAFYQSGMNKTLKELTKQQVNSGKKVRDSLIEQTKRFKVIESADAQEQKGREATCTPRYWDMKWRHIVTQNILPDRSYLLDIISKLIPEGESVADMGCGVGSIAEPLQMMGYRVYGYDFSSESIATIKAAGIQGEVVDIRYMDIPHETYHTVIMSHFIEHLNDEHEKRAVEIASQMAMKQVIIVVPEECSQDRVFIEHHRAYTQESLKKLMEPFFETIETVGLDLDVSDIRWKKGDIIALGKDIKKDYITLIPKAKADDRHCNTRLQ